MIASEVTDKLLSDIKNYLDDMYNDAESDKKLKGIISRGISYLDGIAGVNLNYEIEDMHRALLFDYCRYARSNAIEDFEKNFKSSLVSLRLSKDLDTYLSMGVDSGSEEV